MNRLALPALLLLTLIAHAAIWWTRPAQDAAGDGTALPPGGTATGLDAEEDHPASASNNGSETNAPQTIWEQLHRTDDLAETVSQLREAGFPPRVVRAIATAEIRAAAQPEIDALIEQIDDVRYWDAKDPVYLPSLHREYASLTERIKEQVSDLLGEPTGTDEFQDALDRRRWGDLPSDVLEKLRMVVRDYGDLKANVIGSTGGVLLPADHERLSYLEAEELRDLESLLTPEQMLEYRLRVDPQAHSLRSHLEIMDVSEEEFRLIFGASDALTEQFGPQPRFGGNIFTRNQRNDALVESLSGQLSPERLELLEQALDPRYFFLNSIVARNDLAPRVVQDVTSLQMETMQALAQLRNDPELDDGARTLALQDLRKTAEASLQDMLGEEGFEGYRNMGGQWLNQMVPMTPMRIAPAPAAPVPPDTTDPDGE